jgi:hypothetical protein
LTFAERTTGKSPTSLRLTDLNAKLVLAFLDHIEQVRYNGVRSRKARLAAVRSFLKYAAHHDASALHVIQQTMAVPTKRFDRPMLGFLTRDEMGPFWMPQMRKAGPGNEIAFSLRSSTTPERASRR